MKCVQCEKFQGLKKFNNSVNGSYWKCGTQIITADSDSCVNFTLYRILVCPKKNKFRRMHIDSCLHYQKEKGCKCRIGNEIRQYLRKQPGKIIKRKG